MFIILLAENKQTIKQLAKADPVHGFSRHIKALREFVSLLCFFFPRLALAKVDTRLKMHFVIHVFSKNNNLLFPKCFMSLSLVGVASNPLKLTKKEYRKHVAETKKHHLCMPTAPVLAIIHSSEAFKRKCELWPEMKNIFSCGERRHKSQMNRLL